jgi:uncharacterized RDD family membrane protein YckC
MSTEDYSQNFVTDASAQATPSPPSSNDGSALMATGFSYAQPPVLVRAPAFERWCAWLIDGALVILISLLALIPLLGGILVAVTATGYLLLRDRQGASLGKRVMGLRVVGQDGQPASSNALIMRNAILALPYLLHFIPYLGVVLTTVIWAPTCFIESFSVLLTGQRIGDKLAGTMVVKT